MSKGPVTVVGTGNTPLDLVQNEKEERFLFFDAPLEDIRNDTYTSHISPLASTNWKKVIGWNGIYPLSESTKSKISELIEDVRLFAISQ